MEQIINPSANSEKYIKETDTKVKEFSDKIDSLEKQYASVIKSKDDEINAEKKKVNDISSSLNTIINSKDSIISDKISKITKLENEKIQNIVTATLNATYSHSEEGSFKVSHSHPFSLRKGSEYYLAFDIFALENKNCECQLAMVDRDTGYLDTTILHSKQSLYHDNAQTHTLKTAHTFKVEGNYESGSYKSYSVALINMRKVAESSEGFSQITKIKIYFIEKK